MNETSIKAAQDLSPCYCMFLLLIGWWAQVAQRSTSTEWRYWAKVKVGGQDDFYYDWMQIQYLEREILRNFHSPRHSSLENWLGKALKGSSSCLASRGLQVDVVIRKANGTECPCRMPLTLVSSFLGSRNQESVNKFDSGCGLEKQSQEKTSLWLMKKNGSWLSFLITV